MKRTICLILGLLITSIFTIRAEKYYYFDHITTSEGLPSNTIHCIIHDKAGFVWIGTRDGLCRYDGNNFCNMRDMVQNKNVGGTVSVICEDNQGRIWFSTPSGLFIYDTISGNLQSFGMIDEGTCRAIVADSRGRVWVIADELVKFDSRSLEKQTYKMENLSPTSVAVDTYGTVWASFSNGGLYAYDTRTDRFERRQCDFRISRIANAEDGKILVTTMRQEVLYLDCITLSPTRLYQAELGTMIMNVIEREKGECWIGTSNGLHIRRADSNFIGEARHDPSTPESISADYITTLSKDKDGNVWVGTYYTGLNLWQDREDEMTIYLENPSKNSIKGQIVRSICQDERGYVWFCTEDGWLNRLNPADHTIKNFKLDDGLNLQGLVVDGDKLWICSYGKGLWLFNLTQEKVVKRYRMMNNVATLGIKSKKGNIFAGTTSGLYKYDRANDSFTLIESTRNTFVHSLYQDSKEVIWIGTFGDGVMCIDENGNILGKYTVSDDENSLSSRYITSFYEDSRHRMWITTEGGGVCYTTGEYDPEHMQFNTLTTEDGLPTNVTCAITEDQDGTIWLSTTNGIISLSENNCNVTGLINSSNELTGYQFSYSAVCATHNGVLYFGNTDGMISMTPSKLKIRGNNDQVVITDIIAKNAGEVYPLSAEGKSAMSSDHVEVKHTHASSVYIRFVAPEYSNRRPLYSYSITRGKSKGFYGTTYENDVTFTGLRAGKYRFQVGVVGKDGQIISRRSLSIKIVPHPLLSIWAIIVYVIIGVSLFITIGIMMRFKRKADKARQLSKMVNMKEKEVYNAKINFFTNITHEIRTPLTLIKMPIDKIISSGAYNSSNEKDLRTIQANTDRLLNLTNQILNMRKMEMNEIQMSFIKENLCDIVRNAERLFEQMVVDQHITLTTDMPESPLYIMCAKDSILTIVSNLISNAVKYGNGMINVKVKESEDGQTVTVRVESNGEIIPAEDRENIFQIFFQRENAEKGAQGTGLGLPYARTLANMHNGRLYIDNTVTEMNSFILELPINQATQITIEQPAAEKEQETKLPEFDSSRHSVLIVEDSSEMRNYLAKELSAEYNILTAANGADALEIVYKEKIDLVISDIMMPIMDGCELCNKIKSDTDLSHVPVILLTAAVGVETRLESLESGADGYIEKPFPIELLMSNISNLFRNKEISYKQFINKPLTHYNSVTSNKVDQEYMDKVHEFIMKHISEPDLNIESLTVQIGTSKSSLYRKLKANTGLSINEYIRLCRLKQAAELLSSQKYKINEVAYMTGFSSPSYFATCFLKQFNITPSEFVKNLGQ